MLLDLPPYALMYCSALLFDSLVVFSGIGIFAVKVK